MKLAALALTLGLAGFGTQAGFGFFGESSGLFGESRAQGAGEHTSHFAEGGREEWSEYLDGRRHGACKRWYRDGTLRAEGRYERGKRVGLWRCYAPDGSVDRERSGCYENGKWVSGD